MTTGEMKKSHEDEQNRDAYGFAISKENKQPKDWKEVLRKEEEERQVAWYEFLRRGADGKTPTTHAKSKTKLAKDDDADGSERMRGEEEVVEEEEKNDSFDAVRAVMALIRDDDSESDDCDDDDYDANDEKKNKKTNTRARDEASTKNDARRNSEFDAKRRKELEMLVNNGLPMNQRAKLWEIFANVPSKRRKGLYDDLVRRCQDETIVETVEDNKVCLRETRENRNALFEPEAHPILSERNGSPPKDANNGTNNNNDNNNNNINNTSKAILPSSDDDGFESRDDIHNHVQSFADAKAQVEKDLPRTFPAHPLLDGVGRDALRRVLLAYARYNPKVGYCQGLNFLAGLLLLLMPEESAFYVLGTIVEDILPGYFVTKQMLAPSVDQKILRVFVSQKLPTLLETLDKFNIPLSAITLNWFLCLFVNCLPWETALRVWDVLLFKRDRTVLFQVTLALLESPSILKAVKEPASDVSALATALQSAVTEAFDASALMMTATLGNADVTMHKIEQLARKHKKSVAKEIFGADYNQFMSQSMSFAFTNNNNNKDSKGAEDADSKKLGEMFEKWCTPWRERNKKKDKGVQSLTMTPELEDDAFIGENASLHANVSKVLTFDETDETGAIHHQLVETPMTCDSVQSSALVANQKVGKEKNNNNNNDDDDDNDDEAESAPTTTNSNSFGTSFKEWMSTARKSWEFKRKTSASSSKEVDEVTSTSVSSSGGGGGGGATAAPASRKEQRGEKNKAVVEEGARSAASPLYSRLERLERDAKEKDDVIQKLQKRIEALEERVSLLSSK